MRILFSGTPIMPGKRVRTRCGICVLVQSVSDCSPACQLATQPRGSMAIGMSRWWIMRRSEEHTSELQSHHDLVCRLLLEKKKNISVLHSSADPPDITMINHRLVEAFPLRTNDLLVFNRNSYTLLNQ